MFDSIKFLFILLISQKDIVTSQPAVLFLSIAQKPNSSLGWLVVDVFISHTVRNTHRRTPVNERSAGCRRPLPTLHLKKQKTDLS